MKDSLADHDNGSAFLWVVCACVCNVYVVAKRVNRIELVSGVR